MAVVNRRQFARQAAVAAATLCGRPLRALAGAYGVPKAFCQSPAPPDAPAIGKLASQISGHIITPETPEYDSTRLIFNRAYDRHPALIVRCAETQSPIDIRYEMGSIYV